MCEAITTTPIVVWFDVIITVYYYYPIQLRYVWRTPRTTMVDSKVSPEQTCMLGRFSVVHMGYNRPGLRQLLVYIPTQLRETSVVGTFIA